MEHTGAAASFGAATSLFPWWSFSKTVLSICALRLVEEELLELDTPRPGKPFTLRQLLQHRAGVPDYGKLRSYHEAVARGDVPWSRDRMLAEVEADRLEFTPGSGWTYSNVGYMLVGEAIEEATGKGLARALHHHVLGPLQVSSARLAAGPSDFGDLYWPAIRSYDPGWVYHGCLIGTPLDAAKILDALFGGKILRSSTLQAMLDEHLLGGPLPGRPWTSCGYGLGLMAGTMGAAGRAIGHSGGGPFCVNAVYHFPDLPVRVTIAVFADGDDQGVAEAEAMRLALEGG